MTSDSIGPAWDVLSRKLPSGNHLTAKEIYSDQADGIYCAMDANGQRHLLILLSTTDQELTDNQSRGLSVLTRHLNVASDKSNKYIDITCNDSHGHLAFNLLIEEIARTLGNEKLAPSDATRRVMDKWRRFWSRAARHHLSRAEQIGLFAELWFLSEWLIPKQGSEAVYSWKGPLRRRNDFENADFCVEVKATTSRRGRIYHINGINQLESPGSGKLYFFGVRLAETEASGKSLPELASGIREQISGQYETLDCLEEGLISAGYNDIHTEEYERVKFHVQETCLFEVKDNFPRLSARLIQVPPGIEKIEYEINLNTFDHLIVAEELSEWNP